MNNNIDTSNYFKELQEDVNTDVYTAISDKIIAAANKFDNMKKANAEMNKTETTTLLKTKIYKLKNTNLLVESEILDFEGKWLYINASDYQSNYVGFIQTSSNSHKNNMPTVRNLNVYIDGNISMNGGGIVMADQSFVKLENCNVFVSDSISDGAGGIIGAGAGAGTHGTSGNVKISDCNVIVTNINNGSGGITGAGAGAGTDAYDSTGGNVTISGCNVTVTKIDNGSGGITGKDAAAAAVTDMGTTTGGNVTISGCNVTVTKIDNGSGGITGKDAAAAAAAYYIGTATGGYVKISGCNVVVTDIKNGSGGITGKDAAAAATDRGTATGGYVTISGCNVIVTNINNGSGGITGKDAAAAAAAYVIGTDTGGNVTISNCIVKATNINQRIYKNDLIPGDLMVYVKNSKNYNWIPNLITGSDCNNTMLIINKNSTDTDQIVVVIGVISEYIPIELIELQKNKVELLKELKERLDTLEKVKNDDNTDSSNYLTAFVDWIKKIFSISS
jgi:hypothetical protein